MEIFTQQLGCNDDILVTFFFKLSIMKYVTIVMLTFIKQHFVGRNCVQVFLRLTEDSNKQEFSYKVVSLYDMDVHVLYYYLYKQFTEVFNSRKIRYVKILNKNDNRT